MIIKKIVTGIAALSIVATMMLTSVSAYTKKEAYNQNYSYSGTSSYVSWHITGNTTTAATTASNTSGNVERYMYVYVGKHDVTSNRRLASQSSDITTTNAGAGAGIQRDRTNQYVYYKHLVTIKTDKENEVSIAQKDYRVYQTKN